jgi:hypothetical protein
MKNVYDKITYEELKNFFIIMWNAQKRNLEIEIPEEADPINVLERTEKESISLAKKGIILALQDTLEDTKDLPISQVQKLDDLLKSNNILTLTAVRNIIWNRIPKILQREKIKNEEEYYLIKEQADNLESGLTEDERTIAYKILNEYEKMVEQKMKNKKVRAKKRMQQDKSANTTNM